MPIARAAALSTQGRVALPSLGPEGTIVRIGRTVDLATQSVTAVAEVELRGAIVRRGQIVQAGLPGGQQQWRVPASPSRITRAANTFSSAPPKASAQRRCKCWRDAGLRLVRADAPRRPCRLARIARASWANCRLENSRPIASSQPRSASAFVFCGCRITHGPQRHTRLPIDAFPKSRLSRFWCRCAPGLTLEELNCASPRR